MTPLLWIEDDPALRRVYRGLLAAEGYVVSESADALSGKAAFQATRPRLVLLDLMLPPSGTDAEGLSLLDAMLGEAPETKVIVLSGAGGKQAAIEAIRRGAYDFLQKPVDPDVLLVVLGRARARLALEEEVHSLRRRLAEARPGGALIGVSPSFLAALDLVDRVAPTELPVLITGENLPLRKSRTPPAGPSSRRGAACPSASRSCRPRVGCVAPRARAWSASQGR